MQKFFNRISKEYQNARRKVGPGYFRLKKYFKYIETLPVDEHVILLESKMGKELEWNLIGLLKELTSDPKYREFRIYIAVTEDDREKREKFISRHNMKNAQVILRESEEYYLRLATA